MATTQIELLDMFFRPHGVAVIGASRNPAKLGYAVLSNVARHGYTGPVYPVNPQASEILGLRCYPSMQEVPDPCELAVVIAPGDATPDILEQCGQRGVKAAVVVSGGFSEAGPEGAQLEARVLEIVRRYGMRLLGPNCIGVIDTYTPLDTTFVSAMPKSGVITFLSHSGAVCGGVIDWALGAGVGLNRVITLGNQADLNETDLLDSLGKDPRTRVIAMYLEGVDEGRRFVETARHVSAYKPIVAIKVGRTEAGRQAAASHTGALAGTDSAYQAAFRQAGIIRVPHIEALFDSAISLAYQPLPRGERVAVLTNSGGPGVLAADALSASSMQLASLSDETKFCLRQFLQPHASVLNPVDMLGGADENDYARGLDILLRDPGVDAVLVINVPQVLVRAVRVVRGVAEVIQRMQALPEYSNKPVMTSLIGDVSLDEAIEFMRQAQLPLFPFPERAIAALATMVERRRWLKKISNLDDHIPTAPQRSEIPTLPMRLASSADEAQAIAAEIGRPVVLKVASPDISHKSDVGGVAVGLDSAEAVRAAYERIVSSAQAARPQAHIEGVHVQAMARPGYQVIVGGTRDPQFGPMVMFGSGGIYVELLKDVSFRLAPVTRDEALKMIDETLAGKLLDGLRGEPPGDKLAVADAIVAVSQRMASDPTIAEMDLNPLIVYPAGQGAVAVDVRVVKAE